MIEEREESQDQVAESPEPKYPHLMDHENPGALIAGFPGWFKGAAGFLEAHVSYWVHEGGVLLVAAIVQPNGQVRPWLRHWSSHLEAVRSAENLVAEAEHYLAQMTNGHVMREAEDLTFDDFIEHVRARMNGEFH